MSRNVEQFAFPGPILSQRWRSSLPGGSASSRPQLGGHQENVQLLRSRSAKHHRGEAGCGMSRVCPSLLTSFRIEIIWLAFPQSCCFYYFSFFSTLTLPCSLDRYCIRCKLHLQLFSYRLQIVLNPLATGARNLGGVCSWQVLSRPHISQALAAEEGLKPASVVLTEISWKLMDRIDERTIRVRKGLSRRFWHHFISWGESLRTHGARSLPNGCVWLAFADVHRHIGPLVGVGNAVGSQPSWGVKSIVCFANGLIVESKEFWGMVTPVKDILVAKSELCKDGLCDFNIQTESLRLYSTGTCSSQWEVQEKLKDRPKWPALFMWPCVTMCDQMRPMITNDRMWTEMTRTQRNSVVQ